MEGAQGIMSVEHVSRSGKVYYLHGKPGKGGKPNLFFSTDADGPLVDVVPNGFEIYENVNGQVFLRRIRKKLKKNIITIYETEVREGLSSALAPWVDPAKEKQFRIQHAYYMAVLRFVLTDPAQRRFAPERYCFRGSVDDWISLGPPATLPSLLKKYAKHLGKESFYDLF